MAAILVVDDEASARSTLALLLRHRGHRVREADSVTAAIRELRADAFDVIVTDLRMPDGVGLDVLHMAKVRCPDANVILLTAYPAWESAKEAMRRGAFDYFEKGQEPEGLFRRIDRALEEQASRRRIGLASLATHPAPPASPEGEHRYLTVLFADMRGSTELLADLDLDEARQILDGINSGEVIVRSVASDLRWDYTAVGMPTHVAARMEQLATPGSIVITAETLAQIEARVDVRPLGRVVVKGLTEGVEAYEVLGWPAITEIDPPRLRGGMSKGLSCAARGRDPGERTLSIRLRAPPAASC